MQPHSGAVAIVIKYLLPTIKLSPENFKGKTFYVRTTIRDQDGKLIREKTHDIKTGEYNQGSRMLKFSVGKDYACHMEVIHDGSYEWFDFIKHRHTHVREKFRFFQGSSTFQGDYISEAGFYHKLEGRIQSLKRLEISDKFINPSFSRYNSLTWKYEFEILSIN